jgi:lipoprotein Spr
MKFRIALILLMMPLLVLSQSKKKKPHPSHSSKPAFSDYFSVNQLCPDSAVTPWLYYQVYDWAGTRYKYSGSTKKGIDCSGFVARMYREAYCIPLNGGSRDMWAKVMPVEKECLEEGDLVFFKIKKGQISHVGIYLGRNKFAHASVKMGVIISDLDEEYYKKRFFKGGRVAPAVPGT